MTATRDRHSDLETPDEPAWDEHPIIGSSRGLPWWGAVAVGFGLTAVAAVVDMQRSDELGRIFQITYVVACVIAVAWVRRRSVFTAMVQPPLVYAIVFIGASLVLGDQSSGSLKAFAIDVGLPLANNFPVMAIATGITVLIGGVRLFTQRNPERDADAEPDRPSRAERADAAAGPPPGPREGRARRGAADDLAPPPGRGRFSRGRPDQAPSDRAARAERAERAGKPDRRGQANRAEGVDRPGRPARGERGERGAPPERRRGGADRGGERGAERGGERGRPRGERGTDRGADRERGARGGGRPARDDRGRGADPRRGGGRPQPPRRRPPEDR